MGYATSEYSHKLSTTYLEMRCQWLFELIKLTCCITIFVLNGFMELDKEFETMENGYPCHLYKPFLYYQYAGNDVKSDFMQLR